MNEKMVTSTSKNSSSKMSATPSSPGLQTIVTAQPSTANVNLSEINENTQSSESMDSMATAVAAQIRSPISAHVRFIIALAVLVSQGLALLLCQSLASQTSMAHYFGVGLTIFVSFFSSEWIRIHSFALTRQRRAFFDEANILETYQPRARTHGHLFIPDPPTPGPVVKISDDPSLPQRAPHEKVAFNANRDAHYANMFEHALRIAKEAEESDRQALEAQKSRIAAEESINNKKKFDDTPPTPTSSASLQLAVPKGEPLYDNMPPGDLSSTASDASTTDGTTSVTGSTAASTASTSSVTTTTTPQSQSSNIASKSGQKRGKKKNKTKM